MIKFKTKTMGLLLILLLFLLITTVPTWGAVNFEPSVYQTWMDIPSVTVTAQTYIYKVITADNNDVYVFLGQQGGQFVKYTYATQTWGAVQDVKVGGAYAAAYGVFYNNGVFSFLSTSGRITSGADPANFPAGNVIPSFGVTGLSMNMTSDGKIAIFWSSTDYHGTNYVYSNHSGSFQLYNLGSSPHFNLRMWQSFVSGYSVTIWGYYYSGEDNYFVTNYANWNGTTWVATYGTTSSSSSPNIYIFKPEGLTYSYEQYFNPYYVKNVNGCQLNVGLFHSEYTYRYLAFGNYYKIFTAAPHSQYQWLGITKFNSPDGKIMALGHTSSGKLQYIIFNSAIVQPVSQVSKTVNSLVVRTTQGSNTDFSTTHVSISNNADMSLLLATQSHANNLNGSGAYDQTFSELLPSTSYYFQSNTTDGAQSVFSPIQHFITLPAVPSSVGFTDTGSTSLTISYSNSENGPDTIYEIERSLTGNPVGTDWQQVYRGPEVSFTDAGLTNKTIYYYRVRAINSINDISAYAPISSVQTLEKDNVAPAVNLTLNNGQAILYTPSINIKLVMADNRTAANLLTYSYSFNNGTWSTPAPSGATNGILNLSLPHGLAHSADLTVQFRVADEDDNRGIASGRVYYQSPDELPAQPENEVILTAETGTALPLGQINGQDVHFNFTNTISLNLSSGSLPYQYSLDDGTYSGMIAKDTISFVNLGSEGFHTIKIRSINAAGIGGNEKSYKLVVDYTPPRVQARQETFRSVINTSVMPVIINAQDNISVTLKYRVNQGAWIVLPPDGRVEVPISYGLNVITIDVADEAGNYTTAEAIRLWRLN